jgi:hypothetical protein
MPNGDIMTLFNLRFKQKSGGGVVIDGKRFQGQNVSITASGKVIIDGVEQEGSLINDIKIDVIGDVDLIETTNGDITVQGSVDIVETVNGDVQASSITGKIRTVNGDIISN